MSQRREAIWHRIDAERVGQFDLPGTEFDANHGPNDWIAIACRYLSRESARGRMVPTRVDFEDGLIKAAAVIVAALEHCDAMERKGLLAPDSNDHPE